MAYFSQMMSAPSTGIRGLKPFVCLSEDTGGQHCSVPRKLCEPVPCLCIYTRSHLQAGSLLDSLCQKEADGRRWRNSLCLPKQVWDGLFGSAEQSTQLADTHGSVNIMVNGSTLKKKKKMSFWHDCHPNKQSALIRSIRWGRKQLCLARFFSLSPERPRKETLPIGVGSFMPGHQSHQSGLWVFCFETGTFVSFPPQAFWSWWRSVTKWTCMNFSLPSGRLTFATTTRSFTTVPVPWEPTTLSCLRKTWWSV